MYIDCIVSKVNKNHIVSLKTDCAKTCEGCKGSMFCKQKDMAFEAASGTFNLNINDKVRVYLPRKKTIISTTILFILPIIVMGVFLYLGSVNIISVPLSAILSIAGVLITFFSMYFYNKINDKKNLPIVVELYDKQAK